MSNIVEFTRFPLVRYEELRSLIGRVSSENYQLLLSEPPVAWVMTRGTTGKAKVIPVTTRHVQEILLCGARALVNYALRKKDLPILGGRVLNLNFPSKVGVIPWSGNEPYGYPLTSPCECQDEPPLPCPEHVLALPGPTRSHGQQ